MTAKSNREFNISSPAAKPPSQSLVSESEPESGDPNRHRPDEAQVKVSDSNGVVVYRRNKRLKTADSSGKVVNMDVTKGNSGIPVSNSDVMEVEVKEESRIRRFTRSALGRQRELLEITNGNSGGEVDERSGVTMSGTPTKKLEMKMSKKISITVIPETVKELFETGLLEGYPVFYNGGKKVSFSYNVANIMFPFVLGTLFILIWIRQGSYFECLSDICYSKSRTLSDSLFSVIDSLFICIELPLNYTS